MFISGRGNFGWLLNFFFFFSPGVHEFAEEVCWCDVGRGPTKQAEVWLAFVAHQRLVVWMLEQLCSSIDFGVVADAAHVKMWYENRGNVAKTAEHVGKNENVASWKQELCKRQHISDRNTKACQRTQDREADKGP